MKLIVFSGLPGTGKSTLAEAVGKELGIPMFARDWLEATLLRCELQSTKEGKSLSWAGYELMTVLAESKLILGKSVILDSVAATATIRATWRQLSSQYDADWRVIECICSDVNLHRSRLKVRNRNIPGWHELEWSDVEKVKQYYRPWNDECLKLDMTNLYRKNFPEQRHIVRYNTSCLTTLL